MKMRGALPGLHGFSTLAILAAVLLLQPGRAAGQTSPRAPTGQAMGAMTDDAMRQQADAYWARHTPIGTGAQAAGAVVVTFNVNNFRFNADGNTATQVDTAKISVGDAVGWQWLTSGGVHTCTSGTDSGDPNMGLLFDVPIDTAHRTFTFTFNNPGIFPFFCQFHELSNMKGVVIVQSTAGVGADGETIGFTASPAPNPTPAGVRFGFALPHSGRARAEVFDALGRRIAVALDEDMAAGHHTAAWDGRMADGSAARAGRYELRLRLPGYSAARSIVVTR